MVKFIPINKTATINIRVTNTEYLTVNNNGEKLLSKGQYVVYFGGKNPNEWRETTSNLLSSSFVI